MTENKIDIELLERWWIEKSRVNFFAYRQFIRYGNLKTNWFIESLSVSLQNFYVDFKNGQRPILIITCPPQHGKSWAIEDLVSWVSGMDPDLRLVYASFSEYLGVRCNSGTQRTMNSDKYKKIFPETAINTRAAVTVAEHYRKNSSQIEFVNKTGSLRNTTVGGPITGESLDIGLIDDPFKGRKEANSQLMRDNVWNWFTDDFGTRFSDQAGVIITMTRWHVDDVVGRLLKKYKDNPKRIKVFKYAAIAEFDQRNRKKGEALFPELKSIDFLEEKKDLMLEQAWNSLYQGNPTVDSGNLIKDSWWKWWDALPLMQYTFSVADTAQKKNNWNDYTVFQHWGVGTDGNLYLLDMFYEKVSAPELRIKAEVFYRKHDHSDYGGAFCGFAIEDKSSGIGLIQELELKNLKVHAIPREVDKITRAYNCGPEIKAGKVFLNVAVPSVGVITSEAKQFPNSVHDDAFDCTMNAIECAYIYPEILNHRIFVA